jgi:response regulator RpfG family c-di-GMP phosphodiesterase
MIKSILVDDEMHYIKTLSMLLKDYCPAVQVMDKCPNASTGLQVFRIIK